jgi:hypothetical protein
MLKVGFCHPSPRLARVAYRYRHDHYQ